MREENVGQENKIVVIKDQKKIVVIKDQTKGKTSRKGTGKGRKFKEEKKKKKENVALKKKKGKSAKTRLGSERTQGQRITFD